MPEYVASSCAHARSCFCTGLHQDGLRSHHLPLIGESSVICDRSQLWSKGQPSTLAPTKQAQYYNDATALRKSLCSPL